MAEAIATLVGLLSGKAAIIPATRTSVPQAFEETAASTGPLVLSGASAPRQVPSAAQPESRIETQVVPRKRSPLMTAVLGLVAAMALVGLGALLVSAFQTPEVVHPVASSAPAPPQQVSQVMQPIPAPVVSPAPAVSLAQAGPEPATGAAGIEPAVPAEQAPIEAGSVPSGQAEQGTAPRQDTADGSSELAEEPREERRRDTASSRRASRPAARGPRLQPHEALFVSSIVRACAEGNPRPTQPIPVTLVLELGQFNNVRGMRVTGLDDYAALRRCIVMRGTSFRFTETPPEIPVSFTTMIGPD